MREKGVEKEKPKSILLFYELKCVKKTATDISRLARGKKSKQQWKYHTLSKLLAAAATVSTMI
jgi:hypothetical protein